MGYCHLRFTVESRLTGERLLQILGIFHTSQTRKNCPKIVYCFFLIFTAIFNAENEIIPSSFSMS